MPALISSGMRGIDTIEFGGGMLAEFATAVPAIGIVILAGNVSGTDIGVLCVVLVLPGVDVGLAVLDSPPPSVGLEGSLAFKIDRKPSIAEKIADLVRVSDSSSSPVMDCGDVVSLPCLELGVLSSWLAIIVPFKNAVPVCGKHNADACSNMF